MLRLGIDTTSEACSVALDTGSEILQHYRHAPRKHGELLLPWTDQLLAQAGVSRHQLEAVCVSCGPGSFTSLRLGFSVALGIAFALDIPVYPVSSLQLLAMRPFKQGAEYIVAALDARMSEVYIASYSNELGMFPKLLNKEQLIAPANYQLPIVGTRKIPQWHAVGNGFSAEQSALTELLAGQLGRLEAAIWPQAQDLFILSEQVLPVTADQAELAYLRNQVVQT